MVRAREILYPYSFKLSLFDLQPYIEKLNFPSYFKFNDSINDIKAKQDQIIEIVEPLEKANQLSQEIFRLVMNTPKKDLPDLRSTITQLSSDELRHLDSILKQLPTNKPLSPKEIDLIVRHSRGKDQASSRALFSIISAIITKDMWPTNSFVRASRVDKLINLPKEELQAAEKFIDMIKNFAPKELDEKTVDYIIENARDLKDRSDSVADAFLAMSGKFDIAQHGRQVMMMDKPAVESLAAFCKNLSKPLSKKQFEIIRQNIVSQEMSKEQGADLAKIINGLDKPEFFLDQLLAQPNQLNAILKMSSNLKGTQLDYQRFNYARFHASELEPKADAISALFNVLEEKGIEPGTPRYIDPWDRVVPGMSYTEPLMKMEKTVLEHLTRYIKSLPKGTQVRWPELIKNPTNDEYKSPNDRVAVQASPITLGKPADSPNIPTKPRSTLN